MCAEKHEQPACKNTADVRRNAQTWHHDQRREILWRQDEFNGFERHDSKGVDLLGHTLMLPISAANADPERPLTAMAVNKGPSSQLAPCSTIEAGNRLCFHWREDDR